MSLGARRSTRGKRLSHNQQGRIARRGVAPPRQGKVVKAKRLLPPKLVWSSEG